MVFTESSLLPLLLEDAEVAIYPQASADCVASGPALFTGCCVLSLSVDAEYAVRDLLSTGSLARRVRAGQSQYRISIERVALQGEDASGGGSEPVARVLSDRQLGVSRSYLVVIVWRDEETGRWEKRTYAYAERAGLGMGHDSGVLRGSVSFTAALMSEASGDGSDYDLEPRLLGEVWHVSSAGVESLCYTYDLIENTWARLVATSQIASRVGVDTLSATPSVTVHGTAVIGYGVDVLQLRAGGSLNDSGVVAIDQLARAEFRLFGIAVAAVTVQGELYANGFEAVDDLAGGVGDYAGEPFAFAWHDVRIDAGAVRAPGFEFTLA